MNPLQSERLAETAETPEIDPVVGGVVKFTQKFFALLALQRLPNLYQGTVSYATQQKRRRQNKAARASRRINRGR